jgi:hypothetical protein
VAFRIVKVAHAVDPYRIVVGWRARSTFELSAGTATARSTTHY